MKRVNYYLAVGSSENWHSAFSKGEVWGLPESKRRLWQRLAADDVFFFYVEVPVKGVVGFGNVVSKSYDPKPFLAEDWRTESE